nr:MAB_1171c family putative transporter [Micromonospora sp. DSM 115978]
MDSTTTGYWACAAIAWAALGYKSRDLLRSPREPIHRVICGTLFLVGASLFCAAPAMVAFVNRTSGVPNLAALLVYCLVVGEAAAALTLVAHWRGPADRARSVARRWMIGYAVILVALVALFTMGRAPVERQVDFDTYYARTPYLAQFIVTYLLAHAVAGVGVAGLCWRWAAVAGRPWLRRGLRAIMFGVTLGLGFDVCKLIAVGARWVGADLDPLSTTVAPALAGLGTVVIAAGFVLPVTGEWLGRVGGWLGHAQAYRALYPLWDALRGATPSIAAPIRLPWWDMDLRVARRVTEILDGRLALRPYLDPGVGLAADQLGRTAGLTGADLSAVVDAARIRAGVRAKARHRRFPVDPAGAAADGPAPTCPDGATELARLIKVSRAYVSSPIVAAAADRSAPTPAGNGRVKRR